MIFRTSIGKLESKESAISNGGSCDLFRAKDEHGKWHAVKRFKKKVREFMIAPERNLIGKTAEHCCFPTGAGYCNETSLPCITMPLLSRDLDDAINNNEPINIHFDAVEGALNGLIELDALGLCHRDIKPSNIMQKKESWKLIDFGLATKPLGKDDKVYVGTPHYSAPEQILGTETTIKSDIYAIGIIMYEIVAGDMGRIFPSEVDMYDSSFIDYLSAHGFTPNMKKIEDKEIRNMLAFVLEPRPKCRPTLRETIAINTFIRDRFMKLAAA
jgi:serine/threonine protein kinase